VQDCDTAIAEHALSELTKAKPIEIGRRHVAAAVIGNALEFYDFTVFTFFAVQIGHAFFPSGPHGFVNSEFGSLMAALGTFGAGFVMRPIGGIIIGSYSDRVGRRPAMMLSFSLMGAAILAIAFIPSYSAIGVAAPVLAVLARLVQGFALGGEVGPTTAYLVEAAPANRRGLYASWQSASQSVSALLGGAVGVILAQIMAPDALDMWGWRIAFLIGSLTLPFGIILRRSLPETLHKADHLPDYEHQGFVKGLRDHARPIILGILVLAGGTIATYVLNYMTTFARNTLHMGASQSFAATFVLGLFGMISGLIGGLLSDLYGRRAVMVWPRLLFFVSIYPLFLWIVSAHSTFALLGGTALLSIFSNMSSAAFYVAFVESLPRRVRSGIFSTVYASSIAVFGGTTQLFITWLIYLTGNPLAPALYLMFATAVSIIAMWLMVESAPVRIAKETA
jgi:MHS family citrate/tricarballylate:H+ symporter-like MFS transporter